MIAILYQKSEKGTDDAIWSKWTNERITIYGRMDMDSFPTAAAEIAAAKEL